MAEHPSLTKRIIEECSIIVRTACLTLPSPMHTIRRSQEISFSSGEMLTDISSSCVEKHLESLSWFLRFVIQPNRYAVPTKILPGGHHLVCARNDVIVWTHPVEPILARSKSHSVEPPRHVPHFKKVVGWIKKYPVRKWHSRRTVAFVFF